MKAQFEMGEGRQLNGAVNYIWYREDGYSLYAEIKVPEGASEDYGYLTLKQAIQKALEEKGVTTEIEWWYDGQEQFLAPDATADGDVYCEVETPWYAVQRETTDEWDDGSYNLDEAIARANELGADIIAVIDVDGSVCINELHRGEDF